jgi:hypothetical protein
MAATIILFDRSKQPVAEAVAALTLLREGRERLKRVRDAMAGYRNGADNGADPTNYALLTSAGAFTAGGYATADAAARQFFLQVDTILAKMLTNASVTGVLDSVDQTCAMAGI